MKRSRSRPPAHLCTSPTSADLLSLRLSDESRTSSLSQPLKLSQLHKCLGGLGSAFHPFLHGLSVLSGEKNNISWTFTFFLRVDLNNSCYSCSEPSVVFRSLNHQRNTCSLSFITCEEDTFPVSSAGAGDFRGSQCCGRRHVPFLSSGFNNCRPPTSHVPRTPQRLIYLLNHVYVYLNKPTIVGHVF